MSFKVGDTVLCKIFNSTTSVEAVERVIAGIEGSKITFTTGSYSYSEFLVPLEPPAQAYLELFR